MPGATPVNTGEAADPNAPAGFSFMSWEEYAAANGGASKTNWDNYNLDKAKAAAEWGKSNGSTPAPQSVSNGSVSPASFEQRLAGGEFAGNEAEATQLEVRRRRNLLTDYHDMKDLPPDVADIVLRDASGKVRKARASSTQSALGATFNAKSPLFGER